MVTYALKLGIFLTIIILVGAAVILAAWGLWIMFVAWSLNSDFDRIIIIATSVFWIISGGITWAILRSRNR